MKKTFLLILFFVSSSLLYSETLYPNEVVKLFIKAIKQNNSKLITETSDLNKIASHPRHSMNLKQLKDLFKDIEINDIKFQQQIHKDWSKKITIRIIEPISYDFDLILYKATIKKQEDYYIIVSVHP